MISGYQLKGIKNFKPFSLIGFALAFFCFKTYFTENYDIKNDFVEISGKIKNSELIIKPKYKHTERILDNPPHHGLNQALTESMYQLVPQKSRNFPDGSQWVLCIGNLVTVDPYVRQALHFYR